MGYIGTMSSTSIYRRHSPGDRLSLCVFNGLSFVLLPFDSSTTMSTYNDSTRFKEGLVSDQ